MSSIRGYTKKHGAVARQGGIAGKQDRAGHAQPDGWLDSAGAAAYLSMSKNALHKLTAERRIPFEQDGPGCKCWFHRSDLDAWRQGNAAKTQPSGPVRRLRPVA